MSKLSDRCEERKNEAQALADKFNAEKFLKLDLINIDEFGEIIDDKELVSQDI